MWGENIQLNLFGININGLIFLVGTQSKIGTKNHVLHSPKRQEKTQQVPKMFNNIVTDEISNNFGSKYMEKY